MNDVNAYDNEIDKIMVSLLLVKFIVNFLKVAYKLEK